MNHYEIMYIVPLKLEGDEPTAVQEKVRAMLQTEGAKITSEEALGKRKLAYPIKHVRHGSYVVLECDIERAQVKRVSDWFRLSSEVLRAQIVDKKLKSPEQLAREKAFQEKLARIQAAKLGESMKQAPASNESRPVEEKPKVKLDELDKKLEQILEQEMVK